MLFYIHFELRIGRYRFCWEKEAKPLQMGYDGSKREHLGSIERGRQRPMLPVKIIVISPSSPRIYILAHIQSHEAFCISRLEASFNHFNVVAGHGPDNSKRCLV